ncbi:MULTISPECIES: NAD-dependent epimerase/dehydratase family protein [Haloarcula]|uniref:UDP-glucose 4-epimerase n=1 Tax=Haloarcula pellucida TaxID=1427151 RepID=A0A830GI10_9EURY|nr:MULTISPECIES: NAD-dependent epimerase/dehydratase family protein [Halomicroarcula]MBX0347579.1 NAD-dependent epimerase/dehydratase family protein [Halomicroarcula pellucida]MDS0276499.1 NAD-dependent epimerase/dehydratase family protein [Halomicroarcula sp. S1AR25-4]GGN89388.1 UDP-glucose 4-epimerase [Halomicroarcula pellucida]
MHLEGQHIVVTGGAGFIGSHLVERLVTDNDVLVVDDGSNGRREWVHDDATFVEGDLTDPAVVADTVTADTDLVVHLAASKLVDTDTPRRQFTDNSEITYNLLERMDEVGVERLVFTSSSTVYGEAPRPTPEDYAPLEPISVYGATKLAEESLVSTYAHSHDLQSWVFRFANIVGPRLRGAVVPDFVEKLRENPESLTILGDGRQQKSYMHVSECIEAMVYAVEHADADHNVFNLGTRTTTSVDRIADIVADEMGVDPEYEYTGGDRGWTGDVPRMRLSIDKLAALGWEPSQSSDDAVRQCARELLDELYSNN